VLLPPIPVIEHLCATALTRGTSRKILSDLVREELRTAIGKNSADAIPSELIIRYVVGAYIAVMTWWLDGGAKLPPERMDAMFRRLATEGVLAAYS
jgi:hypothetical protein